jgi:hypothetical protein
MEITTHDIIVIPEDLEVPESFPHLYHKIKHLHKPSIVFSHRGHMNTSQLQSSTSKFVLGLLGLGSKDKGYSPGNDIFLRYVRIRNKKNGEYYHNKGAAVLVDLRQKEGRFFFSFATCNYQDNFNKLIAHNVCKERMENGEVIECINYDPSLSILQNIFIAIGVLEGEYPLTDFDWKGILPEFYGNLTEQQLTSLSTLRRLIRDRTKA